MAEIGDEKVSAPTPTALVTPIAPAEPSRKEDAGTGKTTPAPPRPAIRRVVIPLDGSAFADQAREVGVALAQASSAAVLLVHCYSERAYRAQGSAALRAAEGAAGDERADVTKRFPREHPLHAALAYLELAQAEIARPGIIVRAEAVQWPPSFAIVHLADCPFADLVVMATHLGADCFPQQVAGTITGKVLEHTCVPVLLLPAGWTADSLWLRDSGGTEQPKTMVALAQRNGGTGADAEAHALARSYAELVARSLEAPHKDVHISPDAGPRGTVEISITTADQEALPDQIDMFVVTGRERSSLMADAERLLHTARAPVLVVPEA